MTTWYEHCKEKKVNEMKNLKLHQGNGAYISDEKNNITYHICTHVMGSDEYGVISTPHIAKYAGTFCRMDKKLLISCTDITDPIHYIKMDQQMYEFKDTKK